jgi:biotin carboxyl carrier protein
LPTEYLLEHGTHHKSVTVLEDHGDRAVLQVGDRRLEVTLRTLPDGRIAVSQDDQRRLYRTFRAGEETVVVRGWTQHAFKLTDARERWLHGTGGRHGDSSGRVTASMPGRVVRLSVAVGDIVAPGAVVAVLEAMKMENDVRSVGGGRVTAVVVQEGVAVESGALLVQLEPIGVE